MLSSLLESAIASVARAAEPWRTLYSENAILSTSVLFVHLAALVGSAGLAVASDRALLRVAPNDSDARLRQVASLAQTHRSVLTALTVASVSGLLLLLTDVEAFAVMRAFWMKMALLVLLSLNALLMMRAERHLLSTNPPPRARPAWPRLRAHAATSVLLWFGIVLAGTVMSNY